ncbi:MAG TPA: choline BCCT transporter BetT [Candidatus Corynebacterium gallistercoris]|uniref:Choline BCCT transporter BetT n=1 Tax=Candidatus Corynebacterium gallistercoris TaxID=2838530 RepID=A0A9D1RXD6_9CORY|nr:choline BCCT transporter BetT [Candidatus Corynebacterium gallistercoris]
MSDEPSRSQPKANWVVAGATLAITVAITAWAAVAKENFDATVGSVASWLTGNLGWLYVGTVSTVLIFMVWVAVTKAGNIRLGPDHSKPQYSLFSWSAMLFAAGIGIGILFYSVAEPLAQYANPPVGEGQTEQALQDAVVWTLFHYGISGWALYALMGLAFGYYAYRLNMPLAIRSALYPIIGKRIHGPVGNAVDIAAMLGTIFGVAASLGIGVVQLNYGLNVLLDLPEGKAMQIALIVLAVGVATLSAVSGVDKGIKRLSEFNVYMATALLLFVLFSGKTGFLLDSLVKNMGDYLYQLPLWTFETFSYSQTPEATQEWMANWTLFFWAWWVAWAPFVGLFLARISRGRTFRQFIVGTLFVPFLFLALWASFLGNLALERVMGGDQEFLEATVESPERGFYMLLQGLPLAQVVIVLALVVGILFFVTSADSGALVMAKFSSISDDPQQDGAPWMRVLWSAAVGALTVAMLQVGGIGTLQMATLVMGLPFMVVIFLIMLGLVRSIRRENAQVESRAIALHSAMSSRMGVSEDWEARLDRANTWPTDEECNDYLVDIAQPALSDVARALSKRGYEATVVMGDTADSQAKQLDLSVEFAHDPAFQYQLYPVLEKTPEFAPDQVLSHYYRLEVFGANGSLGFDVYGYTRQQLIGNVLDLFDRHLEYLHMQKDIHGESDLTAYTRRAPEWDEDFG